MVVEQFPKLIMKVRFLHLKQYLLTLMCYYRVMECRHYYEIDLDGKVTCYNCHAVVDEIKTDNTDFWESQTSFEE